MHHSLLVCFDQAVILRNLRSIFTNVKECSVELCVLVTSFPLLYDHDIIDGFDNVKLLGVDPELALLDLGKVKHVLDQELKAKRAGILDLEPLFQLGQNGLALLDYLTAFGVRGYFFAQLSKGGTQLDIEVLLLNVLSNNTVQGVSHLVRDASVYHL